VSLSPEKFSAAQRLAASEPGRRRARVEIIPLIDVIFFLLATFVLFTLSLNKIQSLPVQLPQSAATARPDPDHDAVVLQISAAGSAFWNREPIALADLPVRLLGYKSSTPAPRVLVSGDSSARWGDTVRALDALARAGIPAALETAPRASGR
jgi:biopolymer transport protein ExbD